MLDTLAINGDGLGFENTFNPFPDGVRAVSDRDRRRVDNMHRRLERGGGVFQQPSGELLVFSNIFVRDLAIGRPFPKPVGANSVATVEVEIVSPAHHSTAFSLLDVARHYRPADNGVPTGPRLIECELEPHGMRGVLLHE